MELAYEGNTDLAFDTDVLKIAAADYGYIADELKGMSEELDGLLSDLKAEGWTTPAGTAFYEMTETNWSKNIGKYADLLNMLAGILRDAAASYDNLMAENIRNTKVVIQ